MSVGNFFKRPGAHSEFGSEIGAEPGHPMRPAFTSLDLDLDPYGTDAESDVTVIYGQIGPRAPWEPLP